MFETTNFYKSTYMGDEENIDPHTSTKDNNFSHNIEEANTPLYVRCTKYTKISTILTFYKLKNF